MRRFAGVVFLAVAMASCGSERPPEGGAPEQALAAAALAGDTAAVRSLLAAGADPNRMVPVQGQPQSPWFLALDRLGPQRPVTIEIVKAMLAGGARPDRAWRSGSGDPARPRDSFWKRLGSARSAGTGDVNPLDVAMRYPAPEAVRALVAAKGWEPRLGERALVEAIGMRADEIARVLVEAGVDVNCNPGPTPLVAAVEARNAALVAYLEEHGARERP